MNKLFIAVVGIAAILAAVFLLKDRSDRSAEVKEEPYVKYENTALGFEILRHKEAQVALEGEGRVKFTFLGPAAIPNSEITDGFILTVYKVPTLATSSPLDYAQSKAEEAVMHGGALITEPESEVIAGRQAYKYSYRNLLDTVSWEYVFLVGSQPYTVSYTLIDPAGNNYQSIVSDMLNSIQFY